MSVKTVGTVREAGARPFNPHLAFLDGVRALLAFYVVMHHCYFTVWPNLDGLRIRGSLRIAMILVHGHLAVAGFIFISGLCLMMPVARNHNELRGSAVDFYYRRVRRILPTFYAAAAFSLLLNFAFIDPRTTTIWGVCLPVTPAAIASNLFLVQNVFYVHSVNYVFWSIAVESQIYLLFPILVWTWRKSLSGWFVAITIALSTILAGSSLGSRLEGFHFHYLGLFTLGIFVASGFERQPIVITYWSKAAMCLLACVVATVCMPLFGREWLRNVAADDVFAIALAIVMLEWNRQTSRLVALRKIAAMPWLAFIGTFSYSLYLVHAPIIEVVWELLLRNSGLQPGTQLIALLLIAVPVSVGIAYLFFLCFERPFMSKRLRRAVRESQAVAVNELTVSSPST